MDEEEAERVVRRLWSEEPVQPSTQTLGDLFAQRLRARLLRERKEQMDHHLFLEGPPDNQLVPSPEEGEFSRMIEQYWEENPMPQITVSEEVLNDNTIMFRMEEHLAMSMRRPTVAPVFTPDAEEERRLAEAYEKYRKAELAIGGQPLDLWEWELLQGETDVLQQKRDLEDRVKYEEELAKKKKPAVKKRPGTPPVRKKRNP